MKGHDADDSYHNDENEALLSGSGMIFITTALQNMLYDELSEG